MAVTFPAGLFGGVAAQGWPESQRLLSES